jgi:hypothetical protein
MVGGGCGLESLYRRCLYFINALLVDGNRKSIVGGDSPLLSFPFKNSSP